MKDFIITLIANLITGLNGFEDIENGDDVVHYCEVWNKVDDRIFFTTIMIVLSIAPCVALAG